MIASYEAKQAEQTWPRCWLGSAVAGAIGWYCWPLGQQGVWFAAVISAATWWMCFMRFNRGLQAWDTAAAYRRVRKKSEKPRKDHGRARFATLRDLKKAKMIGGEGLFLGTVKGKELVYPGENSMLAVAGPGQGKTTSLAIPHLLRSSNSTIVIDPKLELWLTTHKARERMGHRVWVINPWAPSFAEQFGGEVEAIDHGFDPCAFLEADSPNIIDDCIMVASLLMPKGAESREADDFWRTFSQTILVGFMLRLLERDDRVTLTSLRAAIMAPADKLEADIEAMEQSEAFSGVLAEYGARMAGPYVNAPKEWSGGHSGAVNALRVYDAHGPLGRHVAKEGVDFRDFKEQPTTCYIAIPSDKMATHAGWVAMVVTLAMEMIARDRSRTERVTFLLDEFQNLPRLEPVLKGLALYRGAGIQFVFLVQFISALKRLYGESWREFLGCEVVSAFGATSDLETLMLFSQLAGQESFDTLGVSSNPDQFLAEALGMSMSLGEQGRPLMRPEDMRALEDGKQLIFAKNLPPILADKQSYLDVPKWRRRAEPNPYYTPKKRWWKR